MESLTYLYMWDGRWVWGLRHPDRPSRIWYVAGLLSLAIGASYLLKPSMGSRMTLLYAVMACCLGLGCLLLGCKQAGIEERRLFSFTVDEHALRINHYFKRKEAIFSEVGVAVLVGSVAKVLVLTQLVVSLRNFEVNSDSHWPLEVLIWLDLAAITVIFFQILSFAVAKGFT